MKNNIDRDIPNCMPEGGEVYDDISFDSHISERSCMVYHLEWIKEGDIKEKDVLEPIFKEIQQRYTVNQFKYEFFTKATLYDFEILIEKLEGCLDKDLIIVHLSMHGNQSGIKFNCGFMNWGEMCSKLLKLDKSIKSRLVLYLSSCSAAPAEIMGYRKAYKYLVAPKVPISIQEAFQASALLYLYMFYLKCNYDLFKTVEDMSKARQREMRKHEFCNVCDSNKDCCDLFIARDSCQQRVNKINMRKFDRKNKEPMRKMKLSPLKIPLIQKLTEGMGRYNSTAFPSPINDNYSNEKLQELLSNSRKIIFGIDEIDDEPKS